MARSASGQIVERTGSAGRTYAARVRAYGERHYLTLGHASEGYSRRRAEIELQNILADIRRGIWQPPQPSLPEAPARAAEPTFHEFASEWLDARRQELAGRTIEDYTWRLSMHLLPFFKGHQLSQITVAEIDRYKAAKVKQRERVAKGQRALSNASINSTLFLLAQILEVAVEYGHIPSNPARGRRRRLKSDARTRTWLEPDQIKPLLDATVRGLRGGRTMPDTRMRALFATAVCTGLRVGELLALRWQDIDLPGRHLTVRASKTEAGRDRQVDLWPEILELLSAYKDCVPAVSSQAFVFATSTGKPDTRSNIARRLKRAVARANETLTEQDRPLIPLELSPHSLRRTFASLLYLRGENPVYVMDQMGHTDPKLALRIYTKVIGHQRRLGPGTRLEAVLEGVRWSSTEASRSDDAA